MSELSPRASDADREHAVHLLREHLVDGRLTLAEFTQRVDAALHAGTADELAATTESLPAVRALGARRRASWITAGLFAHVVRRGRPTRRCFGCAWSASLRPSTSGGCRARSRAATGT